MSTHNYFESDLHFSVAPIYLHRATRPTSQLVMTMAEINRNSMIGIIGILGAILMIVGVFLSWMDLTVNMGFIGSETSSASGWEVFSDDDYSEVAYNYAPVVALVCGVLALIASAIPTISNGKNGKVLGIVILILAIVSVIVSALYYSNLGEFDEGIFGFGASLAAGAGVWVCIAGGAITAISGILDVLVMKSN